MSSQFCMSKAWHGMVGFSVQNITRLKSSWAGDKEKSALKLILVIGRNSVPSGCRTEAPIFLLVVSWELLS